MAAQTVESARVSGRILDVTGGAVGGASVTLLEMEGPGSRSAITAPDGAFVFDAVPAASYVITVNSPGFDEYASAKFTLTAAQVFQLPDAVLSIAGITSSVVVLPTEVIAEQQLKAQEEQRAFGVIPNFYTSYVWNAAPLNSRQKLSLVTREAIDPVSFIGITIAAGAEQVNDTFPGFGSGPKGYAKRWGALFADEKAAELLYWGVFPALFHQDPRYFYQGSGSTLSRVGHAVGSAFIARTDSRHAAPNYSLLLGELSSSALSNLYYPTASRGAGLVLANTAIGLAAHVGENLVREFLYPHAPGGGRPTEN
jgi:hypothetical protein